MFEHLEPKIYSMIMSILNCFCNKSMQGIELQYSPLGRVFFFQISLTFAPLLWGGGGGGALNFSTCNERPFLFLNHEGHCYNGTTYTKQKHFPL